MFRRLATSLLALSLLAPVAAAQSFAQPPAAAAGGLAAPPADRMPAQSHIDQEDMPPLPSEHAPTRALVQRALVKRRAANLARFHAYRTRGVYPHDFAAGTTQNIWRDDEGHLCAAATIIDAGGDHALVDQIATADRYVRLGAVTEGPLLDWILTSGFTQVEISTIQEPFMGPREQPRPRDDAWRTAEDARLRAKYARIERWLKDNRSDAIAQATDRLMQTPDLAWKLVGDELGVTPAS